ncbi:hypothetical protein TNCV_1947831 [Trichonephila clavipes]|nr:hypothetical protein TNCV_1947831 [Trichonephila clavipes]
MEEKDDEEKELSYEDLHRLYRTCPKHDVKIILGDMNAKNEILNNPILDDNNEVVPQPSLEEVQEWIKKLKDNKSPVSDSIPSELMENAAIKYVQEMHHLIEFMWNHEVLPEE